MYYILLWTLDGTLTPSLPWPATPPGPVHNRLLVVAVNSVVLPAYLKNQRRRTMYSQCQMGVSSECNGQVLGSFVDISVSVLL